jgi:phosphoribosylamine-glycine ligase
LDKTKIFEIFPDNTGVLPPTRIIESSDDDEIQQAIDVFGNDAVIKFVGDYSDYYDDSEYRRVRFTDEFEDFNELRTFIANSISSSGQAIVQQRVTGQEFSYTCVVDRNLGQFRLGENIFYKRRFEGDSGPLCDGTGSIAINNTLPGIVDSNDISFIQTEVVGRYIESIAKETGRAPRTFLNVDLIKSEDGRVYLIEVNHRQPGGHTMSTLLAGLETPLSELLYAAQEDRLKELESRYKDGSSVAVTVFPEISPRDFGESDIRPEIAIPHNRRERSIFTSTIQFNCYCYCGCS